MVFSKVLGYSVFAVALGTMAASQCFGSAIQLSFDENGNGTYQDTGTPTQNGYSNLTGTLVSELIADPYCTSTLVSCVGGTVLAYKLPAMVISGPVDVGDLGQTVGLADSTPSDVIFFTTSSGVNDGGLDANLMVFYSADTGGGALADTGLPSNAGTFIDAVDENLFGSFQWLPDGPTYPTGNEYDGTSAEAPEPASISLLGAGLLLLGFSARKLRLHARS